MSMMFDALQALDASAGAPVAPPRGASRAPARPRPWLLLATGGGILLTGSLLWAATRPTAAPATATATRTPATVATAAVTPPRARIAPTPAVAAPVAATAVARTEPSRGLAAPAAASPAPAPAPMTARTEAIAAPALDTQPAQLPAFAPSPSRPAAALVAEISVRDANAKDAPSEGQAVARLVAAINNAVNTGDFGSAGQHLAQLEAELPPRSLTLLRMQAWVAHARGDATTALVLYRKIAERMPSDHTVAINLAILEADNGQPDNARARLQQLRADNVDSAALERAILHVEAKLR